MEPRPGEPGLIGFVIPIIDGPGFIEISARTGSDYGLDTFASGFQHLLPADSINVRLWGTPASKTNDPLRFPFGWGQETTDLCANLPEPNAPCNGSEPVPSDAPTIPFLQNPTTCGVPLTASVDVLSYDGETTHAEVPWPPTTGCEQLAFNPALTAQPTTTQADTPTGLDVNLRAPQTLSEKVPSASELKSTVVTLPEGFSINPNAADGKTSCSDAQANFGTTLEAECPEISKIGTIEIDSSALPAELPGAIYIGEPQPGNKYRIFITGDGFGTHIKLPGSIQLDPQTGRMVVSFKDLPQTPLEGFNFHFFGSDRGLLATPTHCGSYEVKADFEPWDNALSSQSSLSSFTIDSGPNGTPCPGAVRPFNPTMIAGNSDNTAGVYSNLLLRANRIDGDQNMVHINTVTPPGFSAKIAGIPYCPESAIQVLQSAGYSGITEMTNPACPAASQVGTMFSGTGAGTHPLNSPGKIYLAGPYKGAPLSLMFVVPAVSGPYDLGNVAVRSKVLVDPETAQITTQSDRIPEILDGIPLRIKYLHFDFNRQGFTLNPTNCDPFEVDGQIVGDQGSIAEPTALYQVANCADLNFAPKLSLKLKGSTKRRGHPALQATVNAKPGEANIARTQVAMPKTLLLDQSHIGTVCTKVQFACGRLPGGVRVRRGDDPDAAARQTALGPGLPALVEQQTARSRRRSERPDRDRSGGQDRHRQGRRPPGDVREGPGCAGDQVRPQHGRRQEGPPGQQQEPLRPDPEGLGPARRSERHQFQHQDEAADGVRRRCFEEAPKAELRQPRGALVNEDLEERTDRMSRRRERTTILAGAVCASLVALVFAGAASAQIVNLRAYNGPYPGGSFDGTGSVGPGGAPFSSIHQMDINQVNGDFIVGNNNYWYKFNSAGAPSAFSALGTTTMVGTTGQSNWSDVAVDNSGGAGGVGEGEQGRIYGMSEGEGTIKGWKANGEPVSGGFAPPSGLGYGGVCGFDTDSEGDVWAGSWTGGPISEFNPDGTPTGESFNSGKSVCGMEIDDAGNFYIVDYCCGGVWKFSPTGENLGVIDPDPPKPRTSQSTTAMATSTRSTATTSTSTTPRAVSSANSERPKAPTRGSAAPKALLSTTPHTSSTSQTTAGSIPSNGPATSPFPM